MEASSSNGDSAVRGKLRLICPCHSLNPSTPHSPPPQKKNLLAKSQGANTVLINIKPCVTKLFLSLLLNTLWIICWALKPTVHLFNIWENATDRIPHFKAAIEQHLKIVTYNWSTTLKLEFSKYKELTHLCKRHQPCGAVVFSWGNSLHRKMPLKTEDLSSRKSEDILYVTTVPWEKCNEPQPLLLAVEITD